MNIHRAPFLWVLSDAHPNIDQLMQGMAAVGLRGVEWDCVRDDKGLVTFGFASEAALGRFGCLLRSLAASGCDAARRPAEVLVGGRVEGWTVPVS